VADPKKTKLNIGGQAVIEGVFLRAPWGYSVAVRNPEKEIITRKKHYKGVSERLPVFKLPFVRGVANLIEQLSLGVKMLNFSAEVALEEEDETPDFLTRMGLSIGNWLGWKQEKTEAVLQKVMTIFSFVLAFVLAIFLFMVLPRLTALFTVGDEMDAPLIYNMIAGLVRILVFFLYIFFISFFKDVRRLFEYHGAEHKVVFAFEDQQELNTDNVRPYQTAHPRCGTNFIFVVLLISIFIFSFLSHLAITLFPGLGEINPLIRRGLMLIIQIGFLPVVAGFSYEIIRFSARYPRSLWSRLLNKPGLLFQKITTSEPDEGQIEVALRSLEELLSLKNDEEQHGVH